jgi:hypothetical protein
MMSLMESNSGGGGRGAERAVGERSGVAAGGAAPAGVPDPELVERPRRRRCSAEYKLGVLREADACSRPGEVGALLRRADGDRRVGQITRPGANWPPTELVVVPG